jgi:hypothetical protein
MKTAAAILALLAFAQEGKVELKWKFEKGKELRFRQSRRTVVDAAGVALEHRQSLTYRYAVSAVDEKGTADLAVKVEAVAVKSTGIREYEYDSSKDKEMPAEPEAWAIARLVGQAFSCKVEPTGRVAEVKGLDRILEGLIEGMPGGSGTSAIAPTLSEESLRALVQELFAPLTGASVAVGEAWTSESTVKAPLLGEARLVLVSKLVESSEKESKIEQEVKMEPKGEGPGTDATLKRMTGKAVASFSPEFGVVRSLKGERMFDMSAAGQDLAIREELEVSFIEPKKEEKPEEKKR